MAPEEKRISSGPWEFRRTVTGAGLLGEHGHEESEAQDESAAPHDKMERVGRPAQGLLPPEEGGPPARGGSACKEKGQDRQDLYAGHEFTSNLFR